MHRLSWVDPERIGSLARDFFIHALIDMGASYILYDEEGRSICITGLPEKWAGKISEAPSDEGIFGKELSAQLEELRQNLKQAGDTGKLDHESGESFYEFRCRKVMIPDQGIYFIMSVNDRTEERHREKLLQTLLLEVSHRSKNMLAIVQGLASQTARYSGSLDGFLTKFRARLQALSKSQDLITDADWRGAYFNDLAAVQTARFARDNPLAFEIGGDNAFLSPNIAINVGLALHELAANSVTHHDLSHGSGKIKLHCRKFESAGETRLEISWTEHFSNAGTVERETQDARFGSIILEKVVPTSLNGTARFEVGKNASYILTFPVEVEIGTQK